MKHIFHTVVACILFIVFLEAGIPKPLPNADTSKTIANAERVFEADFVSVKTNFLYKGKLMSNKLHNEYQKLNKAAETKELVLRYWDKKGNVMSPPDFEDSNKSDDPFSEAHNMTAEEVAWRKRFSHYTVSISPDSTQFNPDKILIQDLVELKATKILKGIGKSGDIIQLKVYRREGSACPHVLSLGPLKGKKRYFLTKKEPGSMNKYDFKYQFIETESK
ncbi:MAG: hypothetical protein ACSHX0_10125 [Akkermansiaceae bacterium]